jgi:two-component system heavy metal sensor histidine kinase CusS
MSLKNAETKKQRAPLRIPSITGRLAFLYTLSAVVTLVVGAVYMDWSMHQVILQAENDFINDRLRVYRSILRNSPQNLEIIKNDIEWEGVYAPNPEYYIRIVNIPGRNLIETPGMRNVLPHERFECPNGELENGIQKRYCRVHNGRCFLLRCDLGAKGAGSDKDLIIQIALDVTSEERAISEKRKQLISIIILGIAGATGVGVIVARKALSPLQQITGVAEQITIERMSERIDPLRWPTELRRFAVAFNGMLNRLEDSFTRLTQSASNLAHELRTPINNLLGEADVALSRQRSPEEYQKIIESSVEEYHRLFHLIDNMLFLARAENPSTRIEFLLFDPLEEIRKVCSFYEAIADEHGAVIVCQGSGRLYGNQLMFSRIIANLVANALYYSPPGVKIDIFVKEAPDRYLEVYITDTGYGMEEYEVSHIFDRFYRGENLRTLHPEGSGLGLSIVKSVMDLHGGAIEIESSPSKGTIILLRFPPPPPGME